MLYYARHHRLDGNVLDFVGITGGIARRDSGALLTIDNRMRMFERAEQIGFVVDVCNDKTESSTPGKLLACEELQGGGVFVPGTVLLSLALAGRLVEERYGVNVREEATVMPQMAERSTRLGRCWLSTQPMALIPGSIWIEVLISVSSVSIQNKVC